MFKCVLLHYIIILLRIHKIHKLFLNDDACTVNNRYLRAHGNYRAKIGARRNEINNSFCSKNVGNARTKLNVCISINRVLSVELLIRNGFHTNHNRQNQFCYLQC